ncbi:MAG: hypothetical protein PHT27_02220 [Candidatus Izemoplasmatales bacterium]|nr:hypothetical protein [Candidatus Izemoplasmatales bacterium]
MSKLKTTEDLFAYSKTLSVIPAEDLVNLLLSSKIHVPYYIHRFVLRETIYPKVFANALYQTYTDELKYRLRGYNDYSIYLLDKLISDFNLDFDAAKYKEIFFDVLFLNAELYGIKDHFFNELDKLKYKYLVDFETINYHNFMSMFGKIFFEPSGYLDGVKLTILKDVMIHSSTLGDLRGLGEKYGVKVPRRINKTQLVDILAKRFRLSDEEVILLNAKSVLELEIYAKEKGFSISIDLKKSDMVEYIVYSLAMYHQEVTKDMHNYSVPLAVDLDSVKIEEIKFESNDQDIPVILDEKPIFATAVKDSEPIIQEEEVIEPEPMPEPEHIEPIVEPVVEPIVEPVEDKSEPVVIDKTPKVEVQTPVETKTQIHDTESVSNPISTDSGRNFSEEERALLDEKINIIIKKYQRKRHQKTFWTIFWVLLGVAIIGFVGYSYVIYTTTGNLPFGIDVFW